jgi:hypothetical protein
MRITEYALTLLAVAGGTSPLLLRPPSAAENKIVYVVDTVFVKETRIDYDEITARVLTRMGNHAPGRTVIEGDLVVKGRLGVRGDPEPGTDYPVTIHGPGSADILFVANEALLDPQRADNQHRHVGSVGVAQDGGLRMNQNATCYLDARGCATDDRLRRRAFAGFDSLGDMSFYLSDVDSLTGATTAPNAQSLVLKLLDWDRNIHIVSYRPGQRIFFNGSTTLNAGDLVWEVPLH